MTKARSITITATEKQSVKTLLSLREIIVANIQATDDLIQAYLMGELIHIEQHRNPTRLNEFFAMIKGRGSRTTAMHAFVQYYGNIHLDTTSKQYVVKPVRSIDKDDWVDAMNNQHWTLFQAEKEVQQFNLSSRVESLIKQALTAASKEKLNGDVKALEELDKVAVQAGIIEKSLFTS